MRDEVGRDDFLSHVSTTLRTNLLKKAPDHRLVCHRHDPLLLVVAVLGRLRSFGIMLWVVKRPCDRRSSADAHPRHAAQTPEPPRLGIERCAHPFDARRLLGLEMPAAEKLAKLHALQAEVRGLA
jgi:hypothetical protein